MPQRPLYWHELTLMPLWISNHMPSKGWYAIVYQFLNFNGCRAEVWEYISGFIPNCIMHVIIDPWCDHSFSALMKRAPYTNLFSAIKPSAVDHKPLRFERIMSKRGLGRAHCDANSNWSRVNFTELTDDKSTLVRAMAWCRQATSYRLSQCWPRSVSPYGVTRALGGKNKTTTRNSNKDYYVICQCYSWLSFGNSLVMFSRRSISLCIRWLCKAEPISIKYGI